jgi:exodeoxyribonuclease V alpha subunit
MNRPLPKSTLEGELERITYSNPETHYTIAKLKTSKTHNMVTIVGSMPAVKPGQFLKIEGTWETHPKYGQQFKIASYEETLPATISGIKKYLASGIVKGIGPSTAHRMISCFGAKTFEIIEKNPERLVEVDGVGPAKAALIGDAWKNNHAARGVMQLLQNSGVKTAYCAKILKTYGADAVNIIRNGPYRLATDIPGIGFYFADRIALTLGVSRDDTQRVRACIIHVIQQFINEGHVFIFENQLVVQCANLFSLEADITRYSIEKLSADGELVIENAPDTSENRIVYLKEIHQAETGISNRIKALLSVPVIPRSIDSERISK